jgi:hypothetical protein
MGVVSWISFFDGSAAREFLIFQRFVLAEAIAVLDRLDFSTAALPLIETPGDRTRESDKG